MLMTPVLAVATHAAMPLGFHICSASMVIDYYHAMMPLMLVCKETRYLGINQEI